ncbi:tetratricopeptide repeat protein [Inquilinus sp. KBS0705]|nr:tetratricopeptide repeat protein [Inquilinus sp. KBS0705]
MKRSAINSVIRLNKLLFFAVAFAIAGCSLEKKSKFNRAMQNLTAHYNILFNANELLREKQESYETSHIDDYTEILSVYRDTIASTGSPDKDLEEVKIKANKIITIKEQSNYLGDAYLLLAKANYLDKNFFDAVEYANYVIRSFPNKTELKQEAEVWKARALLYLHQPADAKAVIDTAEKNINPKKDITPDVYATKLQYDINTREYEDAEQTAKLAIQYSNSKMQRLRLTYILAQLQELNNKPTDAIANYNRVAKSNVIFEMAFNANLNRIRIEDSQNGVKISRADRLRGLLKEENNQDFIDQIYYQIAQLQYADHQVDDALKNYGLSVAKSTKNQNQKGLSYLRLADIYFKDKADYKNAKNYYDSTLLNLSTNYPGYNTIRKKADNLQILADNLQIIAHEDTLQQLAALSDTARAARIDEMVNQQVLQQSAAITAPVNTALQNGGNPQASVPNGSSFYFYNSKAVSQGYTDFKRVWGNRKLEDNWRRSDRSNTDAVANADVIKNVDPDAVTDALNRPPAKVDAANYRQTLQQNLPLTPELMAQSNQRVFNAYLEIANFYRDVLDDKKEAIATYELLLARYPDNDSKPAIYYNLYRLYSESNTAQSDKYKELLLKNYAQTPFAKTILDPEYGKRMNDEDTEFNTLYNKVYDLYAAKQFAQVITNVDALLTQYPDNKLAAQLYYLRAFAAGHQERLAPFTADLQTIVSKYPEDKLITPLVNQHLLYITANQPELAARPIIITDRDDAAFSIPIVYQQQTEYRVPFTGTREIVPDVRKPEPAKVAAKPADKPAVAPPLATAAQTTQTTVTPTTKTEVKVAAPAPSIFNLRDSTNYYFVVTVRSGTTNLASSRFGIGQFNRVNFQDNTIKHQLKNAGPDNQLIYVGRFTSLTNVKDYARAIIPLMPDIMKVPKDKYSFFIITKENLDKLADQKTVDSYIDYYEKTY